MKITDIHRPDRPNRPFGLRWYVNRKAKHKYFENGEQRSAFRKKLEKQAKSEGAQATQLKAWEVTDYLRARRKLESSGLTVLEAVDGFLQVKGSSWSQKSLEEAMDEYLEAQSNLVSKEHMRQIRRTLDNFRANFKGLLCVSPKEIRDWLDALPFEPVTKQNYRKRLNAFYSFAVRHEWIASNPVSAVASPRVIPKEVGILTPEEASYLFRANEDSEPSVLARLALEAFAGLRYSSACRIRFKDIKWENRGIELPASMMKTERRHYIDGLPNNLWQWLELCRSRSEDWEMTERRYLNQKSGAFRKATQLYREEHRGKGEVPHPKNALRHSFATYHVALNKSPSKTATILCHKSEKKLWDHYKGKATEAEAELYFAIRP